MAIKGLLIWKNPDSTRDLNSVWGLVRKGVYEGGTLTLSGSNLTVTVAPFVAKSHDGMTVVSDNNEVVTLTAGSTQYLVLFAKYETPTPTLTVQLVSETTWLTSSNKDYFVTFAKFVTPALAVASNTATVRYESADYSDKMGQSPWRATVAAFAALPTVGNHDGDVRLALDTYTPFIWDEVSQSWTSLGTTVDLTELGSRKPLESMVERLAVSTSGLIGSVLTSPNNVTSTPSHDGIGMTLVESGSPNQLGFGVLHAYVHGHFIKRAAGTLTLAAKPGVGSRYDIVFLEVWQETIPSALGVGYTNNLGGTDTLAQVLTHFNQTLENDLSPNQTIEAIDIVDAATVIVTKSMIRTVQNVPSSAVSDPSTGMTVATNQFGNAYTQNANSDRFAYTANAPAVHSTRTWAIPLLVLKRRAAEANFVVFDGATNDRYAFDVAPRATLGRAVTEVIARQASDATFSDALVPSRPSGWMTQPALEFGGAVPLGSVRAPACTVRVFNRLLTLPQVDTALPAPPATTGRRDVVYVEFYCTYAAPKSAMVQAGGSHTALVSDEGPRSFVWYARYVAADAGASVDEADSMAALGFTNVPADVALWSRAATADEPTKDGFVYALPVAIVHRRNTGVWNVGGTGVNMNGSTGRPDGATNASAIHAREIVDLRRKVIRAKDVTNVIDESFERLCDGTLRSRLRQNPFATDCYGTSLMVNTLTSAAPAVGKHVMTPVPSAANAHTCWSDSDELIPMSLYVPTMTAAAAGADGVLSWNGGGDVGVLTITAPAGMHLLSRGNSYVQGPHSYLRSTAGANPRWDASIAVQVGLVGDVNNYSPAPTSSLTPTIVTTDALGNVTQASITSSDWTTEGADVTSAIWFTVWFVKPAAATLAAYSTNGTLMGSPTQVYSVTHGGLPVNVGAITATVSKTVTGTSFTVTQADIYALRPELATAATAIRMYGIFRIRAAGALVLPRYARLSDGLGAPGFLQMDVELALAVPANTPIEIEVMCDGDLINRWVEVFAESRQIRGLYSYATAAGVAEVGNTQFSFLAQWVPSHFAAVNTQKGASFSDGVRTPQYGVRTGLRTNFNSRASYVDYTLAVQTANDHTIWYQPADAAALGVTSDIMPGSLRASGTIDLPDIGPNSSPYTPMLMVGSVASITADLTGIGVVQNAPTAVIEVVYEMPVYDGLTDTTTLRSKLRGELAYLGSTQAMSEGAGASALHPSVAGQPLTKLIISNTAITAAGGSYRPWDQVAADTGGTNATGSMVATVKLRSATRVARTRQVPYPVSTGVTSFQRYAPPSMLQHTGISRTPIVRTSVVLVPGSTGRYYRESDPAFSSTAVIDGVNYQATPLLTDEYVWNLPLPSGATLVRVRVRGSGVVLNTLQFSLRVHGLTNSDGGIGTSVLLATATVTTSGQKVVDLTPTFANNQSYAVQHVGEPLSLMLHAQFTAGLAPVMAVSYIEVTYLDHTAPTHGVALQFSSITTAYEVSPLGLENLKQSLDSLGAKTSVHIDSGPVRALVGTIIDKPSTWTGPQETALESAYFVPGAIDFVGDWARGQTARINVGGITAIYEDGLLGFVPFSGNSLRKYNDYNPTMPTLTAAMPTPTPEAVTYVSTAASDITGIQIAVAGVTPYGIINASKELTLGVSTGVYENSLLPNSLSTGFGGSTNVHPVQVGGSTIDGFYPIGRPIVEPE